MKKIYPYVISSLKMSIYYKITNENENHHGYQYKDGLNVLEEPFDEILLKLNKIVSVDKGTSQYVAGT